MQYCLMNKNKKVINFEMQNNTILKITELFDIHYAPICIYNAYYDKSKSLSKELNYWFKGRGIPSWRKDLEKLLMNLNVENQEELLNKSYALSLSDQYWFKPIHSNIQWKDINFFQNDFEYIAYLKATLGEKNTLGSTLTSPNNTTDGMLPKGWIIENNERKLVKFNYTQYNQEPFNEWLASQICSILKFDHCHYDLDLFENHVISKCPNFLTDNQEIICAYDIFQLKRKSNSVNDLTHYISILEEHGLKDAKQKLDEMLIIDFLLMNTDRHMKNFGVIRDVNTLEWVKTLPIFDTGQSLCCDLPTIAFDFSNGNGKLFYNTKKLFSEYLELISDLSSYDFSKLKEVENAFKDVLYQYRPYTEMSELRIDALVKGLDIRINMLIHEQDRRNKIEKC